MILRMLRAAYTVASLTKQALAEHAKGTPASKVETMEVGQLWSTLDDWRFECGPLIEVETVGDERIAGTARCITTEAFLVIGLNDIKRRKWRLVGMV